MANQFSHNYQLLELNPTSNWKMANENYRRLVHACHPDKFAQRPRERIHAQQQFIELTKAFNNLRAFYRENHRLPFEQIKHAVADPPEPPDHQRVASNDEAVFETGILNKRKPSTNIFKASSLKRAAWILPTGATILVGLLTFLIIDHNAKINAVEEASRVLNNTEPSEYLRNNDQISQANGRAAILNESSGNTKMGDKLAKDLFK